MTTTKEAMASRNVNQYGYGLFPVVFRVPVYGLLLSTILYMQSYSFDATKLISVVCFSAIVALIETFWRKGLIKKSISWYLASLLLMCFFLVVLLNQAAHVQQSWYRVNVIEKRINGLILESPIGIIVFDGKSNVKTINESALNLTGWKEKDVVGKNIGVFIPEEKKVVHSKYFTEKVDSLKRQKAVWSYLGDKMFPIVTKNKQIIYAKIYVIGINYNFDHRDEEGSGVEFYAIIQPAIENGGSLAGEVSHH